jgi:hypothetical protein
MADETGAMPGVAFRLQRATVTGALILGKGRLGGPACDNRPRCRRRKDDASELRDAAEQTGSVR